RRFGNGRKMMAQTASHELSGVTACAPAEQSSNKRLHFRSQLRLRIRLDLRAMWRQQIRIVETNHSEGDSQWIRGVLIRQHDHNQSFIRDSSHERHESGDKAATVADPWIPVIDSQTPTKTRLASGKRDRFFPISELGRC